MPSETLKGHIAMGAAAVIWGLMSPVSKLVMQQGEVSSASLATFRLLGAAILFWLASAFVPGEPIERKHRLPLFYASLFGIIFNQMAFTVGVGFTSPADAAIITTITPVLTMILAAFVLREMITGKKIIGVCASAIGAILLVSGSGGRAAALPGDNNLLGDILCLASQCSVAVYFVFFKNLIGRYSPITLLKWMFTYAAAACLPFTFREVGSIHYSALPAQNMAGHCLRGGSGYLCQLYLPVFRPAAAETHRRQHVQLLPAGDRLIRGGDVGHGPLRMDESPLRPAGLYRRASGHRNQEKTDRPGTINTPFLRISAATPCRKGKKVPPFSANMRPKPVHLTARHAPPR